MIVIPMFEFTSSRERRLWIGALVVVVAVYSTLGLAGTLAEHLADRGLTSLGFMTFLAAITIATIGVGLNRRPRWLEVWVGLGVAAALAMIVVRMGVEAAERTHLFEYGFLATLIHQALDERRRGGGRVPVHPALIAVLATALLGWIDEGIQWLIPNRIYDLQDVGFNAIAAVSGTLASVVLTKLRDRGKSRAQ